MKFLIVGIVNNPQITRLRQEAETKDHILDACYSSQLIFTTSTDNYQVSLPHLDITSYDVIYLWTTVKRRFEWAAAAHFLSTKHHIHIVNHKAISLDYRHFFDYPAYEYFLHHTHHINFPKSSIILHPKYTKQALAHHTFPLILKLTDTNQGKGVFKINSPQELTSTIKQHRHLTSSFVIREFIPNDGDIRIFTVNYQAIGAMKRTPPPGSFKSNISQGGSGAPFDLDSQPHIKTLAEKVSKLTHTQIAGIDILLHQQTHEPYVIEINTGPQFTGLEQYTKVNAARHIIQFFETLQAQP